MKKPSQFDAIVVGAGPSGNAAAYTMAKAGLKVLQIERGEYPGSKNVQGAILYSDALEKIIPDFRDDAPLERHIIEQRMWLLDETSFVGTHIRSEDYNKPPYNRYTILRAQFDKWFSSKVREAGALLICETTVNHLIMDGTPRRLDEIEILTSAMKFYNLTPTVLYLNVSNEWAKERLAGRGRTDDLSAEEVEKRLGWFAGDVMPAVERLRSDPNYTFFEINGEQSVADVHDEILKKIVNN